MGSSPSGVSGMGRGFPSEPRSDGRGGSGVLGVVGGGEGRGGGGGGGGGPTLPVNLHLMRRESDSSSSLSREQVRAL